MKFSMKRLAAFTLALVMVLGMLPVVNNSVNAATPTVLTGGPADLGLSYVLECNKAPNVNEWVANGTLLTGSLVGFNNGTNVTYQPATVTLTMTNNKDDAAVLSFDYTSTVTKTGDYVNVNGSTELSGSVSVTLDAGESITVVLFVKGGRGANGSSISIKNLKLTDPNAGAVTTTFAAPDFGSYTVAWGGDTKTLNPGDTAVTVSNEADVEYTMNATPGEGYKFLGWYNVSTGEYLSTTTTYSATYDKPSTIKPIVVVENSPVFKVANNYYVDLDEAVTYATTKGETQITLVDSGTITKSDLGIPAGITLLIPMDDQYTPMGVEPGYTTDVVTPYAYKTLTLADGVELKVSGTVEIESKHTTLQGGKRNYGGRPCGAYGAIYMSPNSKITLNNGATMYAWGYVYGEGSVDALSGSEVYEIMQVTDFPGGSNASGFMDLSPDADDEGDYPYSLDGDLDNDYVKTFPFMQYYVQNIEVALTLYTGASEYVISTVTVGGSNSVSTPAIEFIGADGMFVQVTGSITKEYDPTTDRLIVDVDGEAKVNGMTINMEGHEFGNAMAGFMNGATSFDTSQYILALNNNITININSDKTTIGQDMALLPGVEIYVDEGATLVIAAQTPVENEWNNLTYEGSYGHNVYVYDIDNWGKYIFSNEYLVPVTYSPSTDTFRTSSDLKDVKIDINGTVICDGFVYSTVTLDPDTYAAIGGGAEVISSGKTGKVIMNNGAGTELSAFRTNGQAKEALVDIESVWLKNGNGTFLQTIDAEAGATFEYCATHDAWYQGTCEKCSPPTELTVTWIVNGVDITSDCEYNTVPAYPGGTPSKAQDGCTAYTFAGWSTSADGAVLATLPAATTEATYYAIFTESVSHVGDTDEDHSCNSCGDKVSVCDDSNADHYCDYAGCNDKMSDCADNNHDHYCDYYGCNDKLSECVDDNADHWCDIDCGAAPSECKDANQDHYCDYAGCQSQMDGCIDNDQDHCCDNAGCGDKLSECVDNDQDHYCDYTGCGDKLSTCVDNDKNHLCDYYSCLAELSQCTDADEDHHCDYAGCGVWTSECVDEDLDHYCDYTGCNEKLSDCVDENQDHDCDYAGCKSESSACVDDDMDHYCDYDGCKDELSTCVDDDDNHYCDYSGCYAELSQCTDDDEDHYCDYAGCDNWMSACVDADENHYCDFEGCKLETSTCMDGDMDHYCDYAGCAEELSTCIDEDETHYCDYSGCNAELSDCVDDDASHYCDYNGCGGWMSDCVDEDADHYCDYAGCGSWMSDCVDEDADHYCDYVGCGVELSTCVDDDDNHYCDYSGCQAELSECSGGQGDCTNAPICDVCGQEYGVALGHGTVEGWEYIENADGYHEVLCKDCWEYSYTDDHDYGDDHECECGAIEPYTVTFMDGDTVFAERTFYHGSPLNIYGMNIPNAPTGYGWDGWYDADGDKLVLGMTVTSDLTFYATWKPNTYKLTVYVEATDEYVTLDATYGVKIEDVIAQAVADGKLPAIGDKIRVQDEYFNGECTFTYYDYQNADEEWITIDETTTMPAQNFEIMLNCDDIGWFMSDTDEDGVIDGAEYFDQDSGYLQGWQYVEEDYDGVEGGAWYYFGYQKIGEVDYYFRAEGVTRVPYPEVAINGITYGPNAEDVANADKYGYTDATTSLFVFGEDGKFDQSTDAVRDSESNVIHFAVNGQLPWHLGFVQVDSHFYYFVGENVKATGDVYVTRSHNVDGFVPGGIYTFGADGNMCRYNGITEVGGVLRYYDNSRLMIGNGLTQVDENYIYVNSNGELVVDAEYYVGANDLGIAKGIYYFDENGFIVIPEADPVKNGFYYEDGTWYYYVEGVKGYCAGLISTTRIMWYETADAQGVENQGWVYVKSDGSLVCDATYYVTNVNDHESIASGDKCVFGADCLLQNATNGIVDGYYYVNNQIVYGAGVVVIGDEYYYVKSNGQIVVDQEYWTTNVGDTGVVAKLYTFDENGVFTPEFTKDLKNGIVDGYYYVDGHIAYGAGLLEIEPGKYIYVKSNGELATGIYWITNHNGVLTEALYVFGDDGILSW